VNADASGHHGLEEDLGRLKAEVETPGRGRRVTGGRIGRAQATLQILRLRQVGQGQVEVHARTESDVATKHRVRQPRLRRFQMPDASGRPRLELGIDVDHFPQQPSERGIAQDHARLGRKSDGELHHQAPRSRGEFQDPSMGRIRHVEIVGGEPRGRVRFFHEQGVLDLVAVHPQFGKVRRLDGIVYG